MAWVILEGVDRSGKTTVAKLYEKRGFKVVHMSAPDRKYVAAGYTGPSYMDEIMDLYMKYNAMDVVFDRSPYGECVWPFVYGRKAQLNEEDIEALKEMEDANQAERFVFFDSNVEAHWKRCVDNKEPLNKNQFNQANLLFERMGNKYDFKRVQLSEFDVATNAFVAPVLSDKEKKEQQEAMKNVVTVTNSSPEVVHNVGSSKALKSIEQMKLDKANAINDILSKRIIKSKGDIYDELESDIRSFLNEKLGSIFGSTQNKKDSFTNEEVQILKIYVQQLKRKLDTGK